MKEQHLTLWASTGLTVLCLVSPALALAVCPIAPVKTMPQVSVKVVHDKKVGLYSYTYRVANQAGAPLAIKRFTLLLNEPPIEILRPERWTGSFDEAESTLPSHASWGSASREIQPGTFQSGFVLKSRRSPGLVKYFVEGRTEVPQAVTINGDSEAFPDCPGFFFDKPRFESMTTGMTEGPAPADQISVKVKIKKGTEKDSSKQERKELRPYQETGLLTVVLKGSKEFDVSQADVGSIRLGIGKAAPVWHELRPGEADDDKDDDLEARKAKKLWLQFDLDQVDIECDRDRVLFLEGKTKDGKSLLGGAEIQAKDCDKAPTTPRRKKELEERKKWAAQPDEE